MMQHISLFSGIGGFDLASEWMGWTNVASCEINPFGRKVLDYYWPDAYHHDDIHTLTKELLIEKSNWNEQESTILTGGFPCQPYSTAGKRLGKEDERHLWPEMLRVIRFVRPRWIVGENVHGIISWNEGMVFDEVQADLEKEGYEVWPYVLPACGVNAPHRRDRVWFVAYSDHKGRSCEFGQFQEPDGEIPERNDNAKLGYTGGTDAANACDKRLQRSKVNGITEGIGQKRNQQFARCIPPSWQNFPTQPPIRSRNDGFSTELDSITFPKWRNESIKAAGNAIVPQVVLRIFKTIEQFEFVYLNPTNSNE